ncbi:hypothetical protein CDAR_10691 [Caerostris darwini]|uniref:Transmembrane protein n=1 Tax=Caerostris darwini TaxID=1538125 RepID=A0AAV4SXV5_9ARAC|nr:hypothetical protein CDAR_10691 [Caerostris darwini]
MVTERGRELCKIMDEIYYMTLRNSTVQYTTRARTSIDTVFSTHSVRTCGLYDKVFSHHLPHYLMMISLFVMIALFVKISRGMAKTTKSHRHEREKGKQKRFSESTISKLTTSIFSCRTESFIPVRTVSRAGMGAQEKLPLKRQWESERQKNKQQRSPMDMRVVKKVSARKMSLVFIFFCSWGKAPSYPGRSVL